MIGFVYFARVVGDHERVAAALLWRFAGGRGL